MKYPKYDMTSSSESTVYKFTSTGDRGEFPKAIVYSLMQNGLNICNLGFGDAVYSEEGVLEIDDSIINDNGDRDKILATVASSAYDFGVKNPDKHIIFKGSCSARTRLYRMAISNNFEELSRDFNIWGFLDDGTGVLNPFDFTPSCNCDGFLIKKK